MIGNDWLDFGCDPDQNADADFFTVVREGQLSDVADKSRSC